jgi:hypothetical protein
MIIIKDDLDHFEAKFSKIFSYQKGQIRIRPGQKGCGSETLFILAAFFNVHYYSSKQ